MSISKETQHILMQCHCDNITHRAPRRKPKRTFGGLFAAAITVCLFVLAGVIVASIFMH